MQLSVNWKICIVLLFVQCESIPNWKKVWTVASIQPARSFPHQLIRKRHQPARNDRFLAVCTLTPTWSKCSGTIPFGIFCFCSECSGCWSSSVFDIVDNDIFVIVASAQVKLLQLSKIKYHQKVARLGPSLCYFENSKIKLNGICYIGSR